MKNWFRVPNSADLRSSFFSFLTGFENPQVQNPKNFRDFFYLRDISRILIPVIGIFHVWRNIPTKSHLCLKSFLFSILMDHLKLSLFLIRLYVNFMVYWSWQILNNFNLRIFKKVPTMRFRIMISWLMIQWWFKMVKQKWRIKWRKKSWNDF